MSKLAILTLSSFLLAVIGIVLEICFLPIGMCGNGGWSTIPVLVGVLAIPVFVVSVICLGVRTLVKVR